MRSAARQTRVQITVKTLRGEFYRTKNSNRVSELKKKTWAIKRAAQRSAEKPKRTHVRLEESACIALTLSLSPFPVLSLEIFVAKYEHTFERSLPSFLLLFVIALCFWGFDRAMCACTCVCVRERESVSEWP